jgi:hypothetical protein
MDRRNFLTGILLASVAPAFIKTAGLLMPIKPVIQTVEWPTAFKGYAAVQQGNVWVATYELVVDTEGLMKIS